MTNAEAIRNATIRLYAGTGKVAGFAPGGMAIFDEHDLVDAMTREEYAAYYAEEFADIVRENAEREALVRDLLASLQ
jgi:hypothetical protein